MKFFGFHLMPYQDLPAGHLDGTASSWVTLSNALFDPEKGHRLYRRYIEELIAFDRAGFDGICVNEHHQTAYGLMPSPDVMAAVLVPQTTCRIAILGNAGGTVARAFGRLEPQTRVDAVELDGALNRIGKRYFGLSGQHLHLYAADARPWLAASHARYDALFLDAYRQPYIPFYLLTREFFTSVRNHLSPGGRLAVNVGHVPGSGALEKVVTATLRAAFPYVVRDVVSSTNSIVVASASQLPIGQRSAFGVEVSWQPALAGGSVYTDDRAPVEWLTDLSILHYAAGSK